MDLEIEPEKPYLLDGTESFIAIDRVLPTYCHDLESLFYVFLFIAIGGHRGLPDESRLRSWQAGFRNWPEIAEKKRKDNSSNDSFAAILAEFRQEFKGLESLAYALRDVLFFHDGNDFFTGTDMDAEATKKLYGGMIGALRRRSLRKETEAEEYHKYLDFESNFTIIASRERIRIAKVYQGRPKLRNLHLRIIKL